MVSDLSLLSRASAAILPLSAETLSFIAPIPPTKNLHGRTPIPEVDEDHPFIVPDIREIKAHE
jgi:hypothetical protein